MLDWLRILGSIVLVDLVLSGDNALVIGAVAATIRSSLRWIAFLAGGGAAILLRILLTYSFTILLNFPYLEAAGGVILLVITARLLISKGETSEETPTEEAGERRLKNGGILRFLHKNRIISAIFTILAADASTSLDNVIAIAALARNDAIMLTFGLLMSILLLLIGSAVITNLIERLPWVILIAAIVLTITAVQLIVQEESLQRLLQARFPWWTFAAYVLACGSMIYPTIIWFRNHPGVFSRR